MKLILMPEWVKNALVSEQLPLSAAMSIETVSTTLSEEDVAFYVWLNQHLERWVPEPIVNSFECGCKALDVDPVRHPDLFDQMIQHTVRANKKQVRTLDTSELFGPFSDRCDPETVQFDTCAIAPGTVALIPKKGNQPSLMGMVNDLLFHLNGQAAFSKVAKTPLFHFFLSKV